MGQISGRSAIGPSCHPRVRVASPRMATSWQQAVDTGQATPPPSSSQEASERRGAFKRLRESLSRSRQALQAELSASIADRIDAEAFEGIEEALIMADLGAPATADVVGRLEAEVESRGGRRPGRGPRSADRAAGRAG